MKDRFGLGVLKGLQAMLRREIVLTQRNRCAPRLHCSVTLCDTVSLRVWRPKVSCTCISNSDL